MGQYSSFIVRVWSDGLENLRGNIEHVASHERLVFADPEEIVRFIRDHLVVSVLSSGGSPQFDADEEPVQPHGHTVT